MERINDGRLSLDVTAQCTQKKNTAGNQLKEVSSQSVKDAILIRNKKFSYITVFAQWDFPLHYKNKRYVPPIKFVENQNNLGNTSVTHGMTLYRKGKCLGANSLLLTKNYYKHLNFLNKLLNFFVLIVKKPDVIQKNELYFCNKGSNVIQNQLSKSKHRLKSFVLQACVINKTDKGRLWKRTFLKTCGVTLT
jgi:hypothetical protein